MPSEKKLYTVTVTLEFDMAVMAESDAEAKKIAKDNAKDESEHYSSPDYDYLVREGIHFDESDWAHCLAYGGDDHETVGEIIDRLGLESPYQRLMRETRK